MLLPVLFQSFVDVVGYLDANATIPYHRCDRVVISTSAGPTINDRPAPLQDQRSCCGSTFPHTQGRRSTSSAGPTRLVADQRFREDVVKLWKLGIVSLTINSTRELLVVRLGSNALSSSRSFAD